MDRRSLFQRLALLPLWLLFLWGWHCILFERPHAELLNALRWLAGVAAVYGIALLLWVRHNQTLHRRKTPRRHVRELALDFTHDVLGRPLVVAEPAQLSDPHLVVEIREGRKFYGPAGEPAPDKVHEVSGGDAFTYAGMDSAH